MIKFPCRCGHNFAVEEDQAGGMIQCPRCSRLNDIPLLSDIRNLSSDGTYSMDEGDARPDSNRLQDAYRAFTRDRVDKEGNEIDLRGSFGYEPPAAENDDLILLQPLDEEPRRPAAPKYDPITGELIRAIEVKRDIALDNPQSIPLATRSLNYASRSTKTAGTESFLPFFTTVNFVVIFFIVIGHVIFDVIALATLGIVFPIVGAIPMFMILVGHWGSVVDEIGYAGSDELPRPLRSMSWSEDIWGPFVKVMISIAYCYAPGLLLLKFGGQSMRLEFYAIEAVATIFFPAVLLTATCSGAMENLRPDRVFGVIQACGVRYLMVLLLCVVAFAMYGIGFVGSFFHIVSMFSSTYQPSLVMLSYPALVLGITLMHAFCYYLGLLYRGYNEQFPWVLQRHIHTTPRQPAAQLPARPGPRPGQMPKGGARLVNARPASKLE